jgi:hypothetical protein
LFLFDSGGEGDCVVGMMRIGEGLFIPFRVGEREREVFLFMDSMRPTTVAQVDLFTTRK